MSKGIERAAHEALVVVVAALSALVGGCAPEILAMNVPNPATGANAAGAMQSYEIPPNREDHRYEVTLSEWTPSSLAFHVRFLNADRCGLSSSYSLELVDDAGRHYPFHPTGVVREATTAGHLGATLHDSGIDGAFPVTVTPNTRFVVLQIRPITDRGCTAIDFRWDFQTEQRPVASR